VLSRPQSPYTRALLDAVPRIESAAARPWSPQPSVIS
jgi:ABC-type oligopeptide transport system ATPase subunit